MENNSFERMERNPTYHYIPTGKLCRLLGSESGRKSLDELKKHVGEIPELALASACVRSVGLDEACVELAAVGFVIMPGMGKVITGHRDALQEYLKKILERKYSGYLLRRLYFEMILPVAAAVDAGETTIARAIYADRLAALIADNS